MKNYHLQQDKLHVWRSGGKYYSILESRLVSFLLRCFLNGLAWMVRGPVLYDVFFFKELLLLVWPAFLPFCFWFILG